LRANGGRDDEISIRTWASISALQLQTAISPGNSGGPVLDDAGNIIGLISFFMKDAQNVDYAVAPNEILGFLNRRDSKIKHRFMR